MEDARIQPQRGWWNEARCDRWKREMLAWLKISDAVIYGGHNVGNSGAIIPYDPGHLNIVEPANGFVVFIKQ